MVERGLYLVGTPIGNLKDITLRALEMLKEVDLIAAEDTRRTGLLLKNYEIKKPFESYGDHNKIEQTAKLISLLKSGKKVALVSDSGTPGISDPGFYLVREAIKEGIRVSSIPGPSALISGLVVSGFPTDRFVFEGFLSRKSGRRKKRLKELLHESRTVVFFEAPHRLVSFLKDLLEVLGDRKIALARELTKKFEEIKRGKISELIDCYSKQVPKGEFIVVMGGNVRNIEDKG
ncbi:16S rRNA (cytidine(1402)-2'-O)-methyltransferase [candidate division WOR-3 bacterium]|nr:16S rRNA (cytidine(1402)-2'-O)-methyltransferase [candidate division WOR-3 bacterium]